MKRLAFLLSAAAIAACGDSVGPNLPRLISYDYSLTIPESSHPDAPRGVACNGSFTVTFASADSMALRWDVPACSYLNGDPAPGYEPEHKLGWWNVDAYYVVAERRTGDDHFHRFDVNNGILHCQRGFVPFFTDTGVGISNVEGTCIITPRL